MSGASLRGADNLRRTLGDAARALDHLVDAEQAAGQLLVETAERTSPRRTGRLAQSHGYTVTDAGLTVTAATPYAAFVHAKNPWLADALDQSTDAVLDAYATGVEDALSVAEGT